MNSELLKELQRPFPREWHKDRGLPGGGKFIYIPWEKYAARLDEVVGGDWSTESSEPVTAGDYLSFRCTLTINGTSRTGIGTIRTYPEKNDEGKEKIIGDPLNNSFRDAFTDAAYMFGIGRYLDFEKESQDDVFLWVKGHFKSGKKGTNTDIAIAARRLFNVSRHDSLRILKDTFESKSPEQLNPAELTAFLDLIADTKPTELKAIGLPRESLKSA